MKIRTAPAGLGIWVVESPDGWFIASTHGTGYVTGHARQAAGLRGQADLFRNGRITYKSFDFYVSDAVTRLTEGRQTPVTISPIGIADFLVAVP